MLIVRRVFSDIRRHFPARVPEWIMAIPLIGWAFVLTVDRSTFETASSFGVIAEYGDEQFWANVCMLAATMRLLALIVNGTFKSFRYSPHLRAFASAAAAVFWGQITLGIFVAWATMNGVGTGFFAYGTFTIFEISNAYRARRDVGEQRRTVG